MGDHSRISFSISFVSRHAHSIDPFQATNAKLEVIQRKLELMERHGPTSSATQNFQRNVSNINSPSFCSNRNANNHVIEECPFLPPPPHHELEMVNAAFQNSTFQKPRNDPFSMNYNPGWRQHPNFSESRESKSSTFIKL